MFSDFYVEALCNLDFTICGSYIDQAWTVVSEAGVQRVQAHPQKF